MSLLKLLYEKAVSCLIVGSLLVKYKESLEKSKMKQINCFFSVKTQVFHISSFK